MPFSKLIIKMILKRGMRVEINWDASKENKQKLIHSILEKKHNKSWKRKTVEYFQKAGLLKEILKIV